MSSYNFVSAWQGGGNPGVMRHPSPQWLVFPFPTLATPPTSEFFQLELTAAQCIELWWRARRITFNINYTAFGSTAAIPIELKRRSFTLGELLLEEDLRRPEELRDPTLPVNPTSNQWTFDSASAPNWNGTGGNIIIGVARMFLFFTGHQIDMDEGPDTFAHWVADDEIYPSLSLFITAQVDTPGIEGGFLFRTHAPPLLSDPEFRKAAGFTWYGQGVGGTFDDSFDAAFSITDFQISKWYGWDGTWDEDTGARL